MGAFSVILNLITIIAVIILLNVIKNLYAFSEKKDMTVPELFRVLEKEPSSVSHAYFYEHKGVWATGDGYNWQDDRFAKEGKNLTVYDIQDVELAGLSNEEIKERLQLEGKSPQEIDLYFTNELLENTKAEKNLTEKLISRLTRA